MTPFYYLSPGGGPSSMSFPPEDDQQQLQLFLSPPSSSLITARDPRASLLLGEPEQHDQYPQGLLYYGNSSRDHHHHHHHHHPHHPHHPQSSSSLRTFVNGPTNDSHKLLSSETLEDNKELWEGSCSGDKSSQKWMPSKMRLMQKTMSSSGSSSTTTNENTMKLTLKIQDQRYHVNEISTSSFNNYNSRNSNTTPVIRVCSDCNTTTTPLWRSGPCGPKSLCNACGIRQRKARRAAEDGTVTTVEASSSSRANYKLLAQKKKKPRNLGQPKKSCNKTPEKKLCLKKIALSLSNNSAFQGVFSRDVEEAAILLMELSCGFVPS